MDKHFHSKALGQRVRRERLALDLTQEDLAERCELSFRYISRVEQGGADLRLSTLFRVAKGLGLHPSALLEGILIEEPEKAVRRPRKTQSRHT